MAKATSRAPSFFRTAVSLLQGLAGRIFRRSFFRILLLSFLLLVVLPLVGANVLATGALANTVLESALDDVFETSRCDVSWDRERTAITGPGLTLQGTVTYYNLRIQRKETVQHPSGKSLDYAFAEIPKIVVHYDFKRLPEFPVTRVEATDGVELYFNIHRGDWLDEDLFRVSEGEAAAPSFPQVIVRNAVVHFRADGVLLPPETLPKDSPVRPAGDWYDIRLPSVSLLPAQDASRRLRFSGTAEGSPFGRWELGGTIAPDGSRTEILFGQNGLKFDSDFVSVLADEVRSSADQFQAEGRIDIRCNLLMIPGRDLHFSADVDIADGSLCFVGFPVGMDKGSARAALRIENNNVWIREIRGRRGSAEVFVDGSVSNIGSIGETLQIRVRIKDMLVDEAFRLALLNTRLQPWNADPDTGAPYPQEEFETLLAEYPDEFERGYPDWPGKPVSQGGLLWPDIAEVLPFVARSMTPAGLADFELSTTQQVKGFKPTGERSLDSEMQWKVLIREACASFTGLPETPLVRFPIPLYRCYGVVEGRSKTGAPGEYVIRGYTPDELATIPEADERGLQAHGKLGICGERSDPGQKVFVWAKYTEYPDGTEPRVDLSISSQGLVFDDRFEEVLPESIREIVSAYAPRGRADVERATVTIRTESDDITFEFDIKSGDILARWWFPDALEPLEISRISGNLRIDSRGGIVRFSNMQGTAANSPVSMDLLYKDTETEPEIVYTIGSDNFVLNQGMTSWLPPDLADTFTRFQPEGKLRVKVEGAQGIANKPDLAKGDVEIRAGSVLFDGFPYPLKDVAGRLFTNVTDRGVELTLRSVTGVGSAPETRVSMSGHVLVPKMPDQPAAEGEPESPLYLDLHFDAEKLYVDDALLDALTPILGRDAEPVFGPDGKPMRPPAVQFLEDLRIEGTVDVTGRLFRDESGAMEWWIEVSLNGCSIDYALFPYPIANLQGTIVLDGEKIRIRNCTGEAEGGTVRLQEAGFDTEKGWNVSVLARNLPFSQAFRDALPGSLQGLYDRLSPDGFYDIDLALSGKGEFLAYSFALDTKTVDLDLGLHFDDMTARIDADGTIEGESRKQNASLYIEEVFFKKARFNDLTARAQFFDDRVELPNVRGSFYGGTLEASFSVQEDDYNGNLVIRRADLGQLGLAAFPDAGELQGALDAELNFFAHPDSDNKVGRGRFDVGAMDSSSSDPKLNKCKLAPVPLFTEIFRTTQNPHEFDEAHAYFWLREDRFTFREFEVTSDSARVALFGSDEDNYLKFDTDELHMKLFFTLAPRTVTLFLVQDVLDLMKQILFPLHISGTLNDPEVGLEPLGITELESGREAFPRPAEEP